jgi:hypothetical protein
MHVKAKSPELVALVKMDMFRPAGLALTDFALVSLVNSNSTKKLV